jgi:hypothetical protein
MLSEPHGASDDGPAPRATVRRDGLRLSAIRSRVCQSDFVFTNHSPVKSGGDGWRGASPGLPDSHRWRRCHCGGAPGASSMHLPEAPQGLGVSLLFPVRSWERTGDRPGS